MKNQTFGCNYFQYLLTACFQWNTSIQIRIFGKQTELQGMRIKNLLQVRTTALKVPEVEFKDSAYLSFLPWKVILIMSIMHLI